MRSTRRTYSTQARSCSGKPGRRPARQAVDDRPSAARARAVGLRGGGAPQLVCAGRGRALHHAVGALAPHTAAGRLRRRAALHPRRPFVRAVRVRPALPGRGAQRAAPPDRLSDAAPQRAGAAAGQGHAAAHLCPLHVRAALGRVHPAVSGYRGGSVPVGAAVRPEPVGKRCRSAFRRR